MALDSTSFDYPDQNPLAYTLLDPAGGTVSQTVLARQAPLRRQQSQASAFAPERHGHQVRCFTSGEDYFADVCAAIQSARRSVFITGWQVNWAVQLTGSTRLIDALKSAVDNGAKVYVMPWQSPKVGVDTGDLGTMLAVFQLNGGRTGLRAFCCPAGLQNDHAGVEETFFSHHQKLVVVDGQKAYVGGIDLAFGRRDDASFALAHGWRRGPEVYNTGVPPGRRLLPAQAQAYLDESDLLRATLAVGPLHGALLDAREGAVRSTADSGAGRALDATVDWARQPLDLQSLPRFLREPVRWAQAAGQAAGQTLDAATARARRAFDEAQQRSADELIRQLDRGAVSAATITAVVGQARTALRSAYNALLATNWANENAYAALWRPGAQSMPPGEALFTPDQPRLPWQDVQVRIEGPAVHDLARNFIGRWNSVQKSYLLGSLERHTRIGADLVPPAPAGGMGNGGTGGVSVRVLRSAPLKLQQDEARATPGSATPVAAQHEIHDAMVSAIRNAERFVYIENQFFQSGFGEPSAQENDPQQRSGPVSYLMSEWPTRLKAALTRASAANTRTHPSNHVCRALGERIERAIQWGHDFHAYLVLPVHPEGSLADPAIIGQIHWTMQSLVYASDSLVNRVRLALYAKKVCKEPRSRPEWEAAKRKGLEPGREKDSRKFEDEISHAAVADHLTLLNLRTCQTVAGQVRTEQVYVHSKLLIVDDRIVIVGSANINDRSLAGGRDSELAVLLMDLQTRTAPMDGKNPLHVRTLAHDLRVELWKKHFALLGQTDLVKPATRLAALVDKPADPATWRAIQAVAKANADAYARAFPWVPRNEASIWPVWTGQKGFASSPVGRARAKEAVEGTELGMPFSEDFWKSPATSRAPTGIQGFICKLPVLWTQGENNHPDLNMALLTQLDNPNDKSPGDAGVHQAQRPSSNEPNGKIG